MINELKRTCLQFVWGGCNGGIGKCQNSLGGYGSLAWLIRLSDDWLDPLQWSSLRKKWKRNKKIHFKFCINHVSQFHYDILKAKSSNLLRNPAQFFNRVNLHQAHSIQCFWYLWTQFFLDYWIEFPLTWVDVNISQKEADGNFSAYLTISFKKIMIYFLCDHSNNFWCDRIFYKPTFSEKLRALNAFHIGF